jgi:hypothetical protein
VLYFIEQGLMPKTGKRFEWETARSAHHPLSTLFQDYDWADEVLHARVGRDWYVSTFDNPKEAVEWGDRCWSKVVMGWRQWRDEGLTAHRNYVNLVVASGFFNGTVTRWRSGNGRARGNLPRMYAIPRPLESRVWHELIVHVRWSTGTDGLVEVWHRLRSAGRWQKTVRLSGYPTVQWSQTRPASTSSGTTDKIGAYRAHSSFPISAFQDGFCGALSFRAAQSCLR